MSSALVEILSVHPPQSLLARMEPRWDPGLGEHRVLALGRGICLLLIPDLSPDRAAVFARPGTDPWDILDILAAEAG